MRRKQNCSVPLILGGMLWVNNPQLELSLTSTVKKKSAGTFNFFLAPGNVSLSTRSYLESIHLVPFGLVTIFSINGLELKTCSALTMRYITKLTEVSLFYFPLAFIYIYLVTLSSHFFPCDIDLYTEWLF